MFIIVWWFWSYCNLGYSHCWLSTESNWRRIHIVQACLFFLSSIFLWWSKSFISSCL